QKVIDDLNARIDTLETRIESLEAKLENRTESEPQVQMYECLSRPEVGEKECAGGFSKINEFNVSIRCYYSDFKITGWTNCQEGWVEA
ncbi:hypothetical protein LCGC14_2924290, partial [marine sediment metagenome]